MEVGGSLKPWPSYFTASSSQAATARQGTQSSDRLGDRRFPPWPTAARRGSPAKDMAQRALVKERGVALARIALSPWDAFHSDVMQCFRGAFAAGLAVFDRKASELHKTECNRDFRYGGAPAISRQKRPSRLRQMAASLFRLIER